MQQIKYRNKLTSFLIALTSLLIPGIGQVFGGRFLRGILFISLLPLLLVISPFTHMMDYFTSALIFYLLIIILCLFTIYDAYKVNAISTGVNLQWYNKWYFYICIAICFYLIEISSILAWGYHTFHIVGDKNFPTLQNGETVMVKMKNSTDPFYPTSSMIIYQPPFSEKKIAFAGRIVANSGDTFIIQNGFAYLNNKLINETYILRSHDERPGSRNFALHTVPNGYVMVLSDNRDAGIDSRKFGFVPVNNIEGKILYILWSSDKHRIGLRMN